MKLCTKWERNRSIRGGVNAISIFDLLTFKAVLHIALGYGIIFTTFDLRQLIRDWILAFFDADTFCHAVTLTFDPLTLKVRATSSVTWSIFVRNLSKIEQSIAELFTILRIFAHAMSRCDLDLWPLDLKHVHNFGCHVYKLCTKFERNRIISDWVDDLARFCRAILRVRVIYRVVLRGAWIQLHQTWFGHRAIMIR